jgi:putative membrane protein insertion efficiency factor
LNAVSVRVALTALRAYKLCISPYFRGSCRFLPSCADYAAEAIERHGVLRGGWLAARRLARCHPFCAAGHDPVPLSAGPLDLQAAQDFSRARHEVVQDFRPATR